MIERKGDLFTTEVNYIGHGVNTYGLMGAGIAKTFRDKFKKNHTIYRNYCEANVLKPGGFLVVPDAGKVVVNFASQEKPGADARYEWLFSSLNDFAKQATLPHNLKVWGYRCAIPEIGCGIGGLRWEDAKQVIRTVELMNPPILFEVWHYETP